MTQRAVSGSITLDLTYNYDNKPDLIKKNGSNYVQFSYDGNAERVKKYNYTTGQSVLYFGELYEKRSGAGTIHVFGGNNRVASVFLDGTTQFYHTNHLGSASVITDGYGNRKEQMEYFPFGTYRAVGIPAGTYDFDINFPDVFYTFTGQEEDDELGLYNFKARLYDPVLGRFISADTIVPNPEDPQSLNRYSYCLNNPLRYIDPTGNEETDADQNQGTDTGWGGGNPNNSETDTLPDDTVVVAQVFSKDKDNKNKGSAEETDSEKTESKKAKNDMDPAKEYSKKATLSTAAQIMGGLLIGLGLLSAPASFGFGLGLVGLGLAVIGADALSTTIEGIEAVDQAGKAGKNRGNQYE